MNLGCSRSGTVGDVPVVDNTFFAPALGGRLQSVQSQMLTERAVAADVFVDSIGVNTHFTWGPYNAQFAKVKRALVALGVRHIRDGVSEYSGQWSHLIELAQVGIHATVVASENQAIQDIVGFPSHVPGSVEAFEGPNEANNAVGWAPKLRAFQHLLYTSIKSTPVVSDIPVLGPALGLWRGDADYGVLGDISADLDYGNIHDYFGGNFPDGGVIPWILAQAPRESGVKPIVATETGYCTSSGTQGVPRDVQGDYVPRLFFDQFLNGIRRSLDFELVDENTGSPNIWLNCGLLEHGLTPKPAYEALKNLIALLADRGAPFGPKSLSFSLSDLRHDVHHMLLQKRDGSFYLALWLDTSEYNETTKQEVSVASRAITITFANPVHALTYHRLRPDGSMYAQSISARGQSITVLNADSVGVLHIVP